MKLMACCWPSKPTHMEDEAPEMDSPANPASTQQHTPGVASPAPSAASPGSRRVRLISGDGVRREKSAPVGTPGSNDHREHRRLQQERKQAMRDGLKQISQDRFGPLSPSQRVKLQVATRVVRASRLGRQGPAEGSVLDSGSANAPAGTSHPQMRERHVSLFGVDREDQLVRSIRSRTPCAMMPAVRRCVSSEAILMSTPGGWNTSAVSAAGHAGIESTTASRQSPWTPVSSLSFDSIPRSAPGASALKAVSPEAIGLSMRPPKPQPINSFDSDATFVTARSNDSIDERPELESSASWLSPPSPAARVVFAKPEALAAAPVAADAAVAAQASSPEHMAPAALGSPPSISAPSPAAPAEAPAAPTGAPAIEVSISEVDEAEVATLAAMSELVGAWRNTQTTNLEPFLKHIGIGWAKRKVAVAFRPELSFALVDGVLQVLMPSPIGERLERFPLGEEVPETDPCASPRPNHALATRRC